MKKHLIIPILSFILSLASAGTACAELKVGTVDMKKIFESYWKTKDAETTMSNTRSTLKRDLDERMEKRKELQDSIEKLNDEIKKPELAQATAQKKAKERDDKIGEWQTMMRELQQYPGREGEAARRPDAPHPQRHRGGNPRDREGQDRFGKLRPRF